MTFQLLFLSIPTRFDAGRIYRHILFGGSATIGGITYGVTFDVGTLL